MCVRGPWHLVGLGAVHALLQDTKGPGPKGTVLREHRRVGKGRNMALGCQV